MTREEMTEVVARLRRLAPPKVETEEEAAESGRLVERQRWLNDCGVFGYELARRVLGA
jgi:hypothetical protein